jgi:hypothetical protein
MKIKNIEPATFEYVEMESGELYRRYPSGDWEMLMSESWEPCYSSEHELESLYKDFTRSA